MKPEDRKELKKMGEKKFVKMEKSDVKEAESKKKAKKSKKK